MKKLLLAVLVLPVVVKADIIFVNTFYNDKVTVGEEVVVNTVLELEYYPGKFEYTYDPTMLSITKENVTTPGGSDTVDISNGKITIVVYENGPIDTYGRGYVTLKFTALKSGTTEIEPFLGSGYTSIPGKLTINISEVSSNCKEAQLVEPTPTDTTEKTDVKEESTTKKEKSDNNDILIYVSLGLNAVLLISNIVTAVKMRKKKVEE